MRETTLHFASSLATGFAAVGQPALRVALTSGGDERLAIDPRTGRNRYGVPAGPAPGETCFASSTASPISPRGHAAAEVAFDRLLGGGPRTAVEWTETIRARLLAIYGIPGATAILAASGTDAEFIVLAIARTILKRPVASLLLAPAETGSGVALAAAGRHFLASSALVPAVERGALLDGLGAGDVAVSGIAIRDDAGVARDAAAVDREVLQRARTALGEDKDVLIHCLDTSKTGLAGFSRSTAEALLGTADGRCVVVVDACQLRCSAETIRRDLAAGFLVVVTGSKFAGGPAFSGAVLVPPALAARLDAIAPPAGLAASSALDDWPAPLHSKLKATLPTLLNIGLGLRWEAALAELEPFHRLDPALVAAIVARFGGLVADHVAGHAGLALLSAPEQTGDDRPRTILPIVTRDATGVPLCARTLHRGLMAADGGVFHVGQPVDLGTLAALRVCLGAPAIVDAAALAATEGLDEATKPLADRLAALFAKWSALREVAMDEAERRLRRA